MKRRLLKYLLILPVLMMLPLSAYSLFYFDATKNETTIDTDVRIDDIAENYTFASTTKVDMPTYDIYFFPSLLYMDTSIFGEKPEDFDGYLLADNNGGGLTRVGDKTNDDYYDESMQIGNRSNAPSYYVSSSDDDNVNDPDTIYGISWNENGRDYGVVGEYSIVNLYNNSDDGRYPRNMYRQERFGYWPNKNIEDGRFLPIKFEGVEQLSSYLYNQYIVDPLCSMNDPGNYYVYYFAGWTYKPDDTVDNMPVTQEEGYSLIQSMFRNSNNSYIFDILENPAKYADSEGVIRLYPYFIGEGTYDSYAANDSTRIRVNDNNNIKRFVFVSETHPDITYTTGNWITSDHTITNISLAVSYNILLDSNTKLSIDWMKKDDYSSNEWQNNAFNIECNYIVNKYGQGLYNFYIAVGYNGQNCNDREREIDLNEFEHGLSFNNFNSLRAKNIIIHASAYGDSDDGLHWHNLDDVHNGSDRAPLVIGYEKVADIKIIEGIDTSGDYNSYIQSVYPTSANFAHTNLVDNSYAYLVRNIDLSDDVNKSFQLRFGENYILDISFNNPSSSINVPIEQGSSATQEFVPYGNYFKLTNINGQNFFTVDSELYYHIFDFLLIYDNNSNSFSFYVYRHTDFFVKLYGTDVTLNHDSETGMVIHQNVSAIWENRYGASQEINRDDANTNTDIGGSLSLEETIRQHIGTLSDQTLNQYVLLDHVTQSIVGYFDDTNNFIFRPFIVNKNYILELHYLPDLIRSLSLD